MIFNDGNNKYSAFYALHTAQSECFIAHRIDHNRADMKSAENDENQHKQMFTASIVCNQI